MSLLSVNLFKPPILRENHLFPKRQHRKIAVMELDLMEQLERSAAAPAASDSLPAAEESGEDEILELSLWWSSEDVRSRKRVREGDEEIEGKKPKMEVPLLPYGLQVMPMILQGLNGSCYACMVPCWVPCSVDVAQDSVDKSEIKQNFEMGGMVACDSQQEAADDHGLSFRRSSNSGATFSQSSYAKGESNSTNESRNHSKNSTTNNSTTISAFRDAKSRLKKPPTQIRGRKKLALSRKRRALVFTRSAEGNKIDGYLYQCRKKEVRILCDCHGSFFSPADFVRHAGGPETQHPLRQITVVAS